MKDQISQARQFLNWLLDPKAMVFGCTILHFLTMLLFAVRHEQEFSGISEHWNPVRIMHEPLLLLFASFALLVGRLWSYLLATVVSGYVIYALGCLELIAVSAAHEQPIFSWYVLKNWFVLTYTSQPQYILELALAAVIMTYAMIVCLRYLLHKKSLNGGAGISTGSRLTR